MKKITLLLFVIIIVALLAGCQSEQAQPAATAVPTVEPATAAPAVEPTAEAAALPATVETVDLGALTADAWQWVSFTNPVESFEVEMPESYLLTFNEDGTVAIKADCNSASGSYTTEDGSLTIEVGPMTMAACPPDSRSDQFVGYLGSAARYFFEQGFLYIDLFADGGTMAFAVPAEPESAGDVTSYPWLWTSFTSPVEQFEVETPENYVVTFRDDGTVNIKADCNNASGSYTVEDGSLTIEVGPMTMAACPPDSRSDQFVTLLGSAARYFFEDAQLYIDLFADGGTMLFAPEGEAAMAAGEEATVHGARTEPADTSAIPVEALMNATYSGIYDEPVTLTDGLYEGEPFAEGDSARPTVEYGSELYGDLDGDGVEDAVVFLREWGGGTGHFTYIAAQLNQNGQPVDAGTVWMDEISVRSAAIEDGQVLMEVITMGPGDADCCQTHKASRTYALQEGQLAEIASEEENLEQISAADLDGTSWTLVELSESQPALDGVEVTISFRDGQISGFGGCNNYTSSFTLGEDNPLTMTTGPIVSTKKACPEPILNQEAAYLSALENVSQWGYEFGRLALPYYVEGQAGLSRLLFAPQIASERGQAGSLTGQTWQWVSFTDPLKVYEVESPERYTLTFNDDGTVNIKADCNNASGAYTVEGGSLTIEVGPMTKAACPPESRSDQFVQYLGFAARYFFQDAELYIDLLADGGTMVFAPEGEAELAQAAAAGSSLPPAEIANDEGGPVLVSGEFNWTSSYIPRHFKEPVAVLMDVSSSVIGDYSEYVPSDGQIMGVLTRPLAPAPTAYEVELPIRPDGQLVDLDNDGEDDTGVQVYAAVFASNLVGDSYLEQVEQEGFASILTDPLTGRIREGTLLVYAPDDQQGFPSGAGPDGVYFSADDPAVALPTGFTLATLSSEGQVSFDRSEVATMAILEPASQASPDFSDQGIVESFNSLIDLLKVRYSYTELRGLDWEAIREEYLPRMEEAEQEEDSAAYFSALKDMALSIRDAHVYVGTLDFLASANYIVQATEPYRGTFGVRIAELSDGRFVVTYLDPEGPGAEAGWQVGTEILSVDGVPLAERIETIPLVESAGNPEAIRLEQLRYVLGFPMDSQVAVEYLQPGEDQPRSATLAASFEGAPQVPQPQFDFEQEISFKALESGYYYIQWDMFQDDAYKIAVWQKFLAEAHEAPGIIIDLRRNGGGGTGLMYTMLSYLFSVDDPALMHWIDDYVYDDQAGDLVLEFATDYRLSSPDPDLTYTGLVAVLVSEKSASAAEYFPQFLQRQGRAIVVGEHGTEGAGGSLETVAMPGDLTFYFTKGRTYFAGTDELNLEAKGVSLDVRVPITLENELAKQEGIDVVLGAAFAALEEEAGRLAAAKLPGTSWLLNTWYSSEQPGEPIAIENPTAYTLTFGEDGTLAVEADCNLVNAEYAVKGARGITITLGTSTLAACPEGSYSEAFLDALAEVDSFQMDGAEVLVLSRGEIGVDAVYDSLVFLPTEPRAGRLPADTVAQLDAFLASQVWTDGGNPTGAAPGLVLLVDTPQGRYLKAAGVASLEEGTPMEVDDILEIGSNTKSMLIAVMMQLQEEGLLSFNDKLTDWLPDLAARIPNGDQVDLRLMANMATGFWDYGDDIIEEGANSRETMLKAYTPEELVEYAIENGTPDFLPGEGFKYSNTNYILLGMIAEKASGQSLAQLFQERIFDPLGMQTAVLIEDVPQEGEITTQGYWWQPDGTRLNTTDWNASQGWAAGANAMTAEDLLAYGKALGTGELFQDPDSLSQMLPYNESSLISLGGAYGLGLIDFGHGYWGHGGQTLGFQSLWYTNPEKGTTVVGLTNSAAYPGWGFVTVIDILEGRGLRPLQYISMLPIAEAMPIAGVSNWIWTELDAAEAQDAGVLGTLLRLGPDGSASLLSEECGPVEGTYTTTQDLGISFELSEDGGTCPEGEPLLQLLDLLGNAESWRFENGRLVISLAEGAGELVFEPVG